MEEQKLDYKYGINDNDPFHSLLLDADRSGFYSRTAESSSSNIKYDQNKSYKSFNKSGLFNGFPILEAIFKIDKPFSEMYEDDDYQDVIDDMFSCDCNGKCEFCLSKDDTMTINELKTINNLSSSITDDLQDHSNVDTSKYDTVPLSEKDYKHGLLYVEWDTLPIEK